MRAADVQTCAKLADRCEQGAAGRAWASMPLPVREVLIMRVGLEVDGPMLAEGMRRGVEVPADIARMAADQVQALADAMREAAGQS